MARRPGVRRGLKSSKRVSVRSEELGRFCGTEGCGCGVGMKKERQATRRSPTASQLPLLGSNQDSPDPLPLRLSPPLSTRAFVAWTVPSPSPLRGQAAPAPVSTPSPLGAWLGVASEGSADFESIHARRFRRGVQRAHRQVPLESGVLPVTPRGSAVDPLLQGLSAPESHFTLNILTRQRGRRGR
jgi:hypothetical protein